LPRKAHIQAPENEGFTAIGIASHERIWKLCFELNHALQLHLRRREDEPNRAPAAPTPATLLTPDDLLAQAPLQAIYEDPETLPQVECLLCNINRRSLPPAARPFPFFFLLHYRENAALPWDTDSLLAKLNAAEAVISAVDLTHIKNIKLVLP
jgi:hypothetical protein